MFIIRPTAPYDFHKMLQRVRSHHEIVRVEEDSIIRSIRPQMEADPVIIKARSTGSVDEPEIEVRLMDGHISDPVSFQTRLEQMFTANMDIRSFYKQMERDPVMHRVVQNHYGLRLFTDADLFESIIRTIIGQQVTVSFASTLTKRLSSLGAETIPFAGSDLFVFPSPSQIACLTVEQLRELQFSSRKAEYVIDIAKKVADGTLDLEKLREMDNEGVMETLLPIRGIGRWTVECLLLFGMGRPNLLPAADIGLRNAVRNEYGLDHQATEAEVRKIGAAWAPYQSYATFYLWETLNKRA